MNVDSDRYSCKMCGRCCHQEIPLTVYDVHRIALGLSISDREAFERCVGPRVARKINIFAVSKRENGSCVFLDQENRCTVHSFKPRVCSFFPCPDVSLEDQELWERLYLGSACFEVFWEHAMAENHTKRYIERFGTRWNEEGYAEALDDLSHYIVTQPGERLLVASDESGMPIEMKYNCSVCAVNECRMETEITLKDVQRIALKTRSPVKHAFRSAVAEEPHSYSGGLKLRKLDDGARCVYCFIVDGQKKCSIYAFRPRFCEFVPCRLRVQEERIWQRFFFAAGDIDGHWELEVAASVTREYVSSTGVRFSRKAFDRHVAKIDAVIGNSQLKDVYAAKIRQYRYDVVPIQPVL